MSDKATLWSLAMAAPLFVAAAAEGKFSPLCLSNLSGGADLIVLGTISDVCDDTYTFDSVQTPDGIVVTSRDVRDGTFTVDVEQVLAGSFEGAPLEVRKFADWTCGRRWAPYGVGQRVLLFLTRGTPDEPHAWRIMGGGGEGEMLVEGEVVVPRVPASLAWVHKHNDAYYTDQAQRVPLDPLLSALRDHRRCFKFITHPELCGACGVRETCTIEEVEELRRRSDLHKFLFDETTTLARTLVARWESGRREARAAIERGDLVEAAHHVKWAAVFVESIGKDDPRYLETLRECAEMMKQWGHDLEAQQLELRIQSLTDPVRPAARP
ncbi:MAG: hypothetical protein V1790_13735 [Planctomycetota bacterium]